MAIMEGFISQKSWVSRYRVPLLFLTVGLFMVIWVATPQNFRVSDNEFQSFFNSPPTALYNATIPSDSRVETKRDDTTETEIVEDDKLVVVPRVREDQVQDDSQHVGEIPGSVVVEEEEDEKFVVPLLSSQVGNGNQLMEYKSAAVIARTLNRTLCLSPFFVGPTRHFGNFGDQNSGLYLEDRYNTDVMSKLVKVKPLEECIEKCNKKVDVHWRLKAGRPPKWDDWFNDTPKVSVGFGREGTNNWHTTADVAAAFGSRNDGPKCAGLGGLFPGLRWKGVYIATSAYLQHSEEVMTASDLLQTRAFGSSGNSEPYLSVHWRFEESFCRGHQKGLCFSRCDDGSVIANLQHSLLWENMTREGPRAGTRNGFNGVFVAMSDVSGAIYDRAVRHGLKAVYLSTDGWISNRGKESRDLVAWVVEDLRSKGLNVAGLWQMPGLPNFSDGSSVEPENLAEFLGMERTQKVSNHILALVEQEMCGRSVVFLGTGGSTWSQAVSDTRRGLRCKSQLEERWQEDSLDRVAMDNKVIDTILTIEFKAGTTCRGEDNPVPPGEEDEAPDGWLDYEACEVRLDKGVGECLRITQ